MYPDLIVLESMLGDSLCEMKYLRATSSFRDDWFWSFSLLLDNAHLLLVHTTAMHFELG